jgi:hypothetical protein
MLGRGSTRTVVPVREDQVLPELRYFKNAAGK